MQTKYNTCRACGGALRPEQTGMHSSCMVRAMIEDDGAPEPQEDPEWWFDTSNFDGDPVDLF